MANPYLGVFFTYSSRKPFRPIYCNGVHRAEADMPSRLRFASSADDVHVSCDQETDRVRNGLACSIGSAGPTLDPRPNAVRNPFSWLLPHAGDRLESTSDVVMTDMFDASVRNFEIVPELRCSPYISLICGVEQSITLRDYLTAICDEYHRYSGIRSIYRNPLAVRDSTHSGFVVEFESSVRYAIVEKLTNRWLAPPAGFPDFLCQPFKDSLPSSPNRKVWPFHCEQPPSPKVAFPNPSAKWTSLGHSARHNPVGTFPIVKPVTAYSYVIAASRIQYTLPSFDSVWKEEPARRQTSCPLKEVRQSHD